MAELDPLPTYTVRVHRLDPTLAIMHVEFADLPYDVEVTGRVMGPRCKDVSTVEIAYLLRRLKDSVYQILIPDPSYWSAQRPFVYEGPLQFRRGGQVVGEINVSFGVKAPPRRRL